MDSRSDNDRNYLRTGIITSVLLIVAAFGFSAFFTPHMYGTWVAFIWITSVPALLIVALHWHFDHPPVAQGLMQPAKGVFFLAVTFAAMICGGLFLYFLPGRGAGPTPMLIMATIMSVVAAFWVIVVWRCWPLSVFIKNPVALGVAAWATSYVLGYLLFQLSFNFDFAKHAPFYRAILDPAGAFNAWYALTFYVTTTIVIIVVAKMFEFWPILQLPGATFPLARGIYVSVYVLLISALLMGVFVGPLGFDVVDFMVRVPVSMIFGAFLVTNLMQFRLFASATQPVKGFSLLALSCVLALAMQELYRRVGPILAGVPLPSGPPHYEIELWVATAMLAITFPLIIVVTGFFEFWPLRARARARSERQSGV